MSLNPQTLTALEACGVQQIHLDALLRFLRCHRNGSFTWHGRNGHLEQCELRLLFPSRSFELRQVTELVLVENDCPIAEAQ